MSRKRDFCFTINNPGEEDSAQLLTLEQNPKVRYIIVGREVGSEGTPHLQGYVYFHNAVCFETVKKLLPRSHLEACKGTPDQNIAYCSKDNDFYEKGERPVSQKRKGELGKEYYEGVLSSAKRGCLEEIPAEAQLRFYRTIKNIAKDNMVKVPDTDDVCGIWYYGVTGTGKSRQARELYPDSYLKMCNKWWDGYQGEKSVLIDDFDKSHVHLGHHLKLWGDRYAFLAESKGSASQIRPQTIIITSNWHPADIWGHEPQTLDPILRRFKITHFNKPLVSP